MAEAQKKALSGAELLQLLACETELYDFGGGVVEIRTLTFPEAQKIFIDNASDTDGSAMQALRAGLVSPQLSEADFEQVRAGKAGPLMRIAQRIMQISGMAGEAGAPPLAGDGSSPTPEA